MLCAGLLAVGMGPAHADGTSPIRACFYVTTASGAGELSKIFCANGSGRTSDDVAVWDGNLLLDPMSYGTLVALTDYEPQLNVDGDVVGTQYVFQYDGDLVDYDSIRHELKDQFGFDNVYVGTTGEVFGSYDEKSAAKH